MHQGGGRECTQNGTRRNRRLHCRPGLIDMDQEGRAHRHPRRHRGGVLRDSSQAEGQRDLGRTATAGSIIGGKSGVEHVPESTCMGRREERCGWDRW